MTNGKKAAAITVLFASVLYGGILWLLSNFVPGIHTSNFISAFLFFLFYCTFVSSFAYAVMKIGGEKLHFAVHFIAIGIVQVMTLPLLDLAFEGVTLHLVASVILSVWLLFTSINLWMRMFARTVMEMSAREYNQFERSSTF
jgi:hypothetical protein